MLKLESAFFMFISIKNLQKKVIYGKIYLYSGKNQRGIEMELLIVIY